MNEKLTFMHALVIEWVKLITWTMIWNIVTNHLNFSKCLVLLGLVVGCDE
jgi:hypothetical protein